MDEKFLQQEEDPGAEETELLQRGGRCSGGGHHWSERMGSKVSPLKSSSEHEAVNRPNVGAARVRVLFVPFISKLKLLQRQKKAFFFLSTCSFNPGVTN